jgi:hypothetical protein
LNQELGIAVKRALLLISVITLAFDLAQDGALGKANFFAPHSPVKSLITSLQDFGGSTLNTLANSPPVTAGRLHFWHRSQKVAVAQNQLNRIYFYYLSSSGGIPR